MSEQLQLRRGASAQIGAFTGAQGEVVADTTNNRLVLQDGATPGGFPAARLAEVLTNTRIAVADAAYTALASDRTIAYSALTASRVVSLPAASAFPTGCRLLIVDESGSAALGKTITVAPNGSDVINGVNAGLAIATAYGFLELESNGASKWTVTDSLAAASSPFGASIQFAVLESLVSGLSGATVTGPSIPANCIVFSVGARVTTAVAGATAWEIGYSGALAAFGGPLSMVAAGSTNYGLIGPQAFYAATPVLLTATSGSFSAGAVRLSIHLAYMNPSSS